MTSPSFESEALERARLNRQRDHAPAAAIPLELEGERFMRELTSQPNGLALICGPRGSGKTALSVHLAERLRRQTYVVNMPVAPDWMRHATLDEIVDELGNLLIPDGSCVMIDDADQVADTDDYDSDVAEGLKRLTSVIRHHELWLICNTTLTSKLNRYMTDADALFMKRPSRRQIALERAGIKEMLVQARRQYDTAAFTREQRPAVVYVDADDLDFRGWVHYPLPVGYDDAMSRNKSGNHSVDSRRKVAAFPRPVPQPFDDVDDLQEEDAVELPRWLLAYHVGLNALVGLAAVGMVLVAGILLVPLAIKPTGDWLAHHWFWFGPAVLPVLIVPDWRRRAKRAIQVTVRVLAVLALVAGLTGFLLTLVFR